MVSGPPILTIALNRITMDYSTFQRVKLADKVTFAQLLNFNYYLNGYENIKNKKYQQEVEKMQKYNATLVERNKDLDAKKQANRISSYC